MKTTNSNYSLEVLEIHSNQGGSADLIPFLSAMEIFEDIHSPFLQAQIDVIETESLIETLPIVGDEYVVCEIRVKGVTNSANRLIKFDLDVYKIEDEQTYKHRSTSYRLRCISKTFKNNANARVRKYYIGTQDAIVQEICDAQLSIVKGNKREAVKIKRFDPCEFEEGYIFPNWHPIGCIKKLCKNASSVEYKDSDYFFYEDLDGLHFVSASFMIESKVIKPQSGKNFKPVIIQNFTDSSSDFNITDYHKKHSFDTVKNVNNGMHGTTLIHHDLVNRRWREDGSDYLGTFHDFKHNAFTQLTLLAGEEEQKNRIQLMPMNGIDNPGVYTDEFYRDIKKKQVIRQMQTEQNLMVLEIDGEPKIKVGYPIDFEFMSIKGETEIQNDKLRGEFLITKIRHVFMREEYKQFVEISKDSYEQ